MTPREPIATPDDFTPEELRLIQELRTDARSGSSVDFVELAMKDPGAAWNLLTVAKKLVDDDKQ